MKKEILLENGTFVDVGSLKIGECAMFTKTNGNIIKTSPVVRFVIENRCVEVETKNSIYYMYANTCNEV